MEFDGFELRINIPTLQKVVNTMSPSSLYCYGGGA